ncbi:Lrp/AsnC ligand binding domain-containing protein [Brevundimonas olei]|uniref:Lrp/AsnC ligand binding domain-containing protein n=1 Tax=Brevundimonas olei TaxID=657642 RepID=UPI003BB1A391
MLHDERADTVDRAKALFSATPEVQQCYYVTGGVSFMLIVIAPDMRVYEGLTRRWFAENDLVASYRTLVALDRVKAGCRSSCPDYSATMLRSTPPLEDVRRDEPPRSATRLERSLASARKADTGSGQALEPRPARC